MMYVEQYAQQRLNEQQADRERELRRIAEHWHEDARTVRASKWAVVRVFDWIMDRRAARSLTSLPDGARPQETAGEMHNDAGQDAATATAADASGVRGTESEPLWSEGSIAGRFAECAGQSSKATGSIEEQQRKELASTR